MSHKMGQLEWAEARNGTLNFTERIRLVSNLARLQTGHVMDKISVSLGMTSPATGDLESIIIPDSKMAQEAIFLAEECQSLPLLLHTWRTFYFGSFMAKYANLTYDSELFLCASLLHDLGLTEAPGLEPLEHCCFAVSGARFAKKKLTEKGFDEGKVSEISDMIALHLNFVVSAKEHSPEAHLLTRGACCDVFGAGRHRISPETIDQINQKYPREGSIEALRIETAQHLKGTRAGIMSVIFGGKAPPDAFL